jgi:hypothetical protein
MSYVTKEQLSIRVIPAKAGIQAFGLRLARRRMVLDSRFRGNDRETRKRRFEKNEPKRRTRAAEQVRLEQASR